LPQEYQDAGSNDGPTFRENSFAAPESYNRWLGTETDPHDLLITYPSEPMTMWPISMRVNTPANDEISLLDEVDEAFDQKDLRRVSTVR
jgi:putative SOS response-associated peptidase YedK